MIRLPGIWLKEKSVHLSFFLQMYSKFDFVLLPGNKIHSFMALFRPRVMLSCFAEQLKNTLRLLVELNAKGETHTLKKR